jgi:hypothetical protein
MKSALGLNVLGAYKGLVTQWGLKGAYLGLIWGLARPAPFGAYLYWGCALLEKEAVKR